MYSVTIKVADFIKTQIYTTSAVTSFVDILELRHRLQNGAFIMQVTVTSDKVTC
jgi:hypothetical protein